MPSDSAPVPRLPRRHAPRPRLTDLLDETAAQAIVVNAPAGYGKTTLAREWLGTGENVAWYRATPASADLAAFAVGIADALAPIVPGAGDRLRQRVRVSESPEESRPLAELLAEDLTVWPEGAWLVIDDYHLLMESKRVEEFVDWLLALAPLRLLVTTRRRPGWASARRLLYGEIIEVGREQLAMTSEEASRIVAGRSTQAVDALVAQADGWPALIGLAALAASAEVPKARVSEALFRYFAEEVLRRERPAVQEFMLVASVPATLTARFAEEVLGLEEPAAMLEWLAGDGLLEGSDQDGFRFHPLLRDFLRQKLAAERPDLLARVAAEAIAAAKSVGRWDEAFEIAVEAERLDEIEAITAQAAPALLAAGRLETVEKWLDACRPVALQRPALALAKAEARLHRYEAEEASALALGVARRLRVDDPLASHAWYLAGHAARLVFDDERAFECLLEARRRALTDEARMRALYVLVSVAARLELEELDEYLGELERVVGDDLDGRLRLALARFYSSRQKGTFAGLWEEFESLIPLAEHASDPDAAIQFFFVATSICKARGQYALALELADRAVASCERFRLDHRLRFCLIPRADAEISCGNLRRARETAAQLTSGLNRRHEQSFRLLADATFRLKLMLAEGALEELPDELEPSLHTRFVKAWLGEYRALVAVAAAALGDLERSRTEAARASEVSRTIHVRFYVRFAEVIRHAVAGKPEDEVRREAVQALGDALDAEVVDAFVTACRAYPRLLDLVEGDPIAHTRALRAVGVEVDGRRRVAAPSGDDESPLTPREEEVLGLMTEGLSNAEIAERLVISGGTAKVHVHNILEKLGAKSRIQAIVKANALPAEPR